MNPNSCIGLLLLKERILSLHLLVIWDLNQLSHAYKATVENLLSTQSA